MSAKVSAQTLHTDNLPQQAMESKLTGITIGISFIDPGKYQEILNELQDLFYKEATNGEITNALFGLLLTKIPI
ncbi:hypothetical protein BBI01_01445 [Chryseobacterium artocarpi]|uniref:Uncharacterized protein n=1 Tax=Chryseobacterium artocarpi TaxID=1414727 RepID=A0A1B8ZZY8_9FLAO|nr:hypothetical protein BBI01_01445 [Chryseobacterium artocarpi]